MGKHYKNVLNKFGDTSITPQQFASPVTLKKGNVNGIPKTQVLLQSTSANDWHELRFLFVINALQVQDNQGNVKQNSLTVRITVFDSTGATQIKSIDKTVKGKTLLDTNSNMYKVEEIILQPNDS